jgi:uncharacterized membrane protein YcaP (DUF421 family)
MSDWLTVILDAAVLLPLLMLVVRVTGLRSFAKMSAHDFAVTVATGSVVASTVLNPDTPWWMGVLALAALVGVQTAISGVRTSFPAAQRWTDNEPLVLMRDGQMWDEGLRKARMTEDDLRQKLRGAGITQLQQAALVVLETTGDVSVLQKLPERALTPEVRGIGETPAGPTGSL